MSESIMEYTGISEETNLRMQQYRIGNLVNFDEVTDESDDGSHTIVKGGIGPITVYDFLIMYGGDILFSDIELSEEWLIKGGFKKKGTEWKKGNIWITYNKRFNTWDLWKDHGGEKNCHIITLEFVHTLQNAYPVISRGEELTFK